MMKAYMGVDIKLRSLLSPDMSEDEQSASLRGCFNPGDGVSHTHIVGGWMFFRDSLDIPGKRKSLATTWN
jgi:hypothetical protein